MAQTQTMPPPRLARRRFPWSIAPAFCALIFGIVWLLSGWLVYGATYYAPIVAVLLLASVVLGIVRSRSTRIRRRILAGIGLCALTILALSIVYSVAWMAYTVEAARFARPSDARNTHISADPVRWDESPIMWSVQYDTALSQPKVERFYRDHLAANGTNWKRANNGLPDHSKFVVTEDDRSIIIHILDIKTYRLVAIHSRGRDDLSPFIGTFLKRIGRWW